MAPTREIEPSDRLVVGVALDGAGWHPAAWLDADSAPESLFTPDYWTRLIVVADDAGLDFATFEDALRLRSFGSVSSPEDALRTSTTGCDAHAIDPAGSGARPEAVEGRLDALLTASLLGPRTHRIGLIPTVTTTHTEPFHVATALQTLDFVSQGRAGWQLRISADAATEANFGRHRLPRVEPANVIAGRPDAGLNERLDDAAESAEVARLLWDSWEDDAVIRDVSTGRFLDRNRVHRIDFEGTHFSVVGPSIVPRSPQGQIPVTLLSHSPRVHALAAAVADVVFVTPENEAVAAGASRGSSVADIVREVREAEASSGRVERGLAPLRIVADLVVALDDSSERAADRLARLDAFAGSPLSSDARIFAGSVSEAATLIQRWKSDGIDGVRLRPVSLPTDLRRIADELLPELRSRGLAADAAPEGRSLREAFALAPAANRFTARTTETQEVAA